MLCSIEKLINKELNKDCYVLGLGPSLKNSLDFLKTIDREKTVIISCNHIDAMTDIVPDYWVIANNLPEFNIEQNYKKYNKFRNTKLVYCYRACNASYRKKYVYLKHDKFYDQNHLQHDLNLVSCDFVPFSDCLFCPPELKKINISACKRTLNEVYCDYIGQSDYMYYHKNGGRCHTVATHMLKLAIILGCKNINISGVDLDYSKGYVNNSPKNGVKPRKKLGLTLMKAKGRDETIKYIKLIKDDSKKVGVKLYSLIENGNINSVLEYKKT